MLRSNDKTKLSRSELIKKIDDQQRQIADYEKKLKDVVRAYKGLNAERDALQATVEALDLQQETAASTEEQHDEKSETTDVRASAKKEELLEEDRIGILKRSLVVLTAEKRRREAAFQSDKKALLAENETLKERLAKAANETEAQAEKLESRLMELRSKIRRIEGDREKELADHGSVLAAVQQQYAKERANSELLEKQIAELRKKMQEKEEAPRQLETDIASLKAGLSKAQIDLEFWKKKAEKTPTVQMLESELEDVKESSKNEIAELKEKFMEATSTERESRLRELEQRLQEMTTEMGGFDRIRADLQYRLDQLEKKNKALVDENTLLKASESSNETEESTDFESLRQTFLKNAQKLRDAKHTISFYELLGLEETSYEQRRRYEILKDEYERYKIKAQAVLKSRSMNNDALEDTGLPRASSLPTVTECSSCAAAEADLRHMRSVVASLHDKLHSLEIDHANAKNDYDEKTAHLQRKIIEMQMAQENSASDLRNQMHQKVAEMESEMQKQRIRTLDILAEKENELEITKAILASIKSQQNVDPMDPPQGTSLRSVIYRKSRSRDFGESSVSVDERRKSAEIRNVLDRSPSDAGSYSSVMDEHRLERLSASPSDAQIPFVFPGTTGAAEARNIFYEQQLARKEKEIVELRNAIRVAELNVRDIQQASLTKDLQHFEMVEKLKDEVRILEGKLKFLSGDANMEYLRNIFIQLLHCDSSSGRKHILKAIGAVLKLSKTEMRAIERHSH